MLVSKKPSSQTRWEAQRELGLHSRWVCIGHVDFMLFVSFFPCIVGGELLEENKEFTPKNLQFQVDSLRLTLWFLQSLFEI